MNPDSKMCQKCQNYVCKGYNAECRKYMWLDRFGQTNIYNINGKYFRKIETGLGAYKGMSLWQPMIKIFWFYIPNLRKQKFWLDNYGFEGVK